MNDELTAALRLVAERLVDLVATGVAERLRPQLGELVAIHGAAPSPHAPGPRPGAPADLLTIAEAAALLNVPRNTCAAWVYRTRTIPHVSVGKLCRIRRADLDAFVHASPPTGPRGSAREQALEFLKASEQRSELSQRRRLERLEVSQRRKQRATPRVSGGK